MKFKIIANLVVFLTLIFLSTWSSTKTVPSSQAYYQNTRITSFSKSKKLLLKLYKAHPVTLYCGCSFKGKKTDLSSCGYIPKKDKKRANRIEWEHVVPVHTFGQSFSEWRNGHPKCVNKKGKKFKGRKCAEKRFVERLQEDICIWTLFTLTEESSQRKTGNSLMHGIKMTL